MQVSSVSIRANLVVTEPVAQVSRVLMAASVYNVVPVANIAYILVAAAARLDTTGRYQYKIDSFVTTDNKVISFQKSASESVSVSDLRALNVNKITQDSFGFTEEFSRTLTYIRAFSDSFGVTESVSKSVSKLLADSFFTSDQSIKTFFKNVSDQGVVSDTVKLSTAKVLSETFGTMDSKYWSLSKLFSDQFATSDQAVKIASKVLGDSALFADALIRSFGKSLIDGVGMNDYAGAHDGVLYSVAKSFSNVAFATDATAIGFSATRTDAVSTSDSGSGVSQSYCDPTYFAEDYVGSSFKF
jgi:hypothetical protein